MSVAKVIEVTSESSRSFEDAIQQGIARTNRTVKHIEGAWIKEQKLRISEGRVVAYRVNLQVTFVLDE